VANVARKKRRFAEVSFSVASVRRGQPPISSDVGRCERRSQQIATDDVAELRRQAMTRMVTLIIDIIANFVMLFGMAVVALAIATLLF
jgi:hypothetical protein